MNYTDLSPRQREILDLLTKGRSNKEIARILGIAEGTTKCHVTALLRRLGARNRTEAAYKASEMPNNLPLLQLNGGTKVEADSV